MKTRNVHIDTIKPGDTVRCPYGYTRTVSADNIKQEHPEARTLWGDSYMLGHKPVKLCVIERATT